MTDSRRSGLCVGGCRRAGSIGDAQLHSVVTTISYLILGGFPHRVHDRAEALKPTCPAALLLQACVSPSCSVLY